MRIHMRGPDGTVYPMSGVYREVVRPKRLVFSSGALDAQGVPLFEVLTAVTLAERQGQTELTLEASVLRETAAGGRHLDGMEEGWNQTLDRLIEAVTATAQGVKGFVITRTFEAPRERVWKAFTELERLKRWWGPKGCSMQSARLDLRPGGLFHYGMRSPDGHDLWGRFQYREIAAPERLVFVVAFTDAQANPTRHPLSPTWPLEVLNTMTLAEHEGRTTIMLHGIPLDASAEEQRTFEAGRESMHQGFTGTLDQLADYLAREAGEGAPGDEVRLKAA